MKGNDTRLITPTTKACRRGPTSARRSQNTRRPSGRLLLPPSHGPRQASLGESPHDARHL
jgi:hypothetical protein